MHITVDWRPFYFYALRPFAIISKTLKKIISDKADGILNSAPLSQQPFSDSRTIIRKALLLGKVPQDSLEICMSSIT
nr:unnamed protein product [Callosobruchus chinensis]